jgi:hypothetical protein
MGLIFDRGEIKLILEHIASLFLPGKKPTIPETYGPRSPGSLDGWSRDAVNLLLEEGRRSLDSVNTRFEALRNRAQYLLAASVASLSFLVGLVDHFLENIWTFLLWAFAAILILIALLISFAAFASTAQLGSVDPVLFSDLDVRDHDEAASSLARAYVKAFKRSTNAVHVRFTLYRDAIWFLVSGIALGALTWGVTGAVA